MRLKEIIRAEKTDIETGDWNCGKIPKKYFPLARAKSLKFGPKWQWRLVKFVALEGSFRVLIRLHEEKEYFSAILALDTENSLKVICHRELHMSHMNWHCHYVSEPIEKIHEGVLRDRLLMKRYPLYRNSDLCTLDHFPVTKANALTWAARFFRFQAQGELI